jgi:N-acylglucosamine 2-epimerase
MKSQWLSFIAVFAFAVLLHCSGNKSAAESCPTGRIVCLPDTIAGMSLAGLRNDYRERLFDSYLPFWHQGGYDSELGGFICHLNDDGSPADDEKNIWFQGRAVWVYSFLYNNFGKDRRYLEIAGKTRDFMVEKMYAGDGRWYERVHRDGTVIEGVSSSVYGWLFAAGGLVELYCADGRQEDLDLALESLKAALAVYNDPGYKGVFLPGGISTAGIRTQGHSMVLLRLLTRLLSMNPDPELEALAAEQLDLIMNQYYNPEYGISNEYLNHDYSRIPGFEDQMFTGHSIEVLWMVMYEALRKKDRALFDTACERLRRYLALSWDYIFDGFGSGDFFVFGGPQRQQGTNYSVKTMWLQCEVMLGCMLALEYTGAPWARQWYEKTRAFTLRTVAANDTGVWEQAVDRLGKKISRESYHPKRKGNFHQPRYMMLNMLILDRMIKNRGKLTPFPS